MDPIWSFLLVDGPGEVMIQSVKHVVFLGRALYTRDTLSDFC